MHKNAVKVATLPIPVIYAFSIVGKRGGSGPLPGIPGGPEPPPPVLGEGEGLELHEAS